MYTGPDEVHNQTCTLVPSLNWTETAAVGVGALTQRKTIYVHDSNLFIRLYISWFQSIYMIYISWYHTSYHTNIMGLTCNTNTLVYTLLPSANKLKWFFLQTSSKENIFCLKFFCIVGVSKSAFLGKVCAYQQMFVLNPEERNLLSISPKREDSSSLHQWPTHWRWFYKSAECGIGWFRSPTNIKPRANIKQTNIKPGTNIKPRANIKGNIAPRNIKTRAELFNRASEKGHIWPLMQSLLQEHQHNQKQVDGETDNIFCFSSIPIWFLIKYII